MNHDDEFHIHCNQMRRNASGRRSAWCDYDSAAKLQHMCESLMENTVVKHFYVRHAAMTKNGMLALAELLQQNIALETLSIHGTVSERTNNEKDGLVFEQALAHCHLQSLALYYDNHSVPCGGLISNVCNGLAQNATIRSLGLTRIHLKDNDALALGNALKANNSLQSLRFNDVSISDVGLKNICYGLQRNCTITKFLTYRTPISSKGVPTIGDMLKENTSIKELKIGFFDDVGKEAKETLVRTMIDNFTLESIDLQDIFPRGSNPLQLVEQCSDYAQSHNDIFNTIRHLNTDGRRRQIMKQSNDVPIGLWAHILASSRCAKSTDVLFHFIKSKPELFKF